MPSAITGLGRTRGVTWWLAMPAVAIRQPVMGRNAAPASTGEKPSVCWL